MFKVEGRGASAKFCPLSSVLLLRRSVFEVRCSAFPPSSILDLPPAFSVRCSMLTTKYTNHTKSRSGCAAGALHPQSCIFAIRVPFPGFGVQCSTFDVQRCLVSPSSPSALCPPSSVRCSRLPFSLCHPPSTTIARASGHSPRLSTPGLRKLPHPNDRFFHHAELPPPVAAGCQHCGYS